MLLYILSPPGESVTGEVRHQKLCRCLTLQPTACNVTFHCKQKVLQIGVSPIESGRLIQLHKFRLQCWPPLATITFKIVIIITRVTGSSGSTPSSSTRLTHRNNRRWRIQRIYILRLLLRLLLLLRNRHVLSSTKQRIHPGIRNGRFPSRIAGKILQQQLRSLLTLKFKLHTLDLLLLICGILLLNIRLL